jgi:ubiquinone/menaquinone biosynthesis C-methylase UbiE
VSDDKRIRDINAYYDRRAPWHDGYLSWESHEKKEELLAPIIKRIEPFVQDRDVLEIACGTGNWTQVLAARARSVTATDMNESMIAIARTKPYTGVQPTLLVADAYQLETIDGSFDTAFMADWWSHVPRQRLSTFLKQLHRKLRRNGIVAAVDMMAREDPKGSVVRIDEDGNRLHRRTLPDGSRFEIVKNYPSHRELSDIAALYADEIHYWQDDNLLRWVLVYRLRE